jgi:hypothetical protein
MASDALERYLTPAKVWYANKHDIPFLATTSLHGATSTLGDFHRGISIWMRKLNSRTIATDGLSATFGGGILTIEVKDALWAVEKQAGAVIDFKTHKQKQIITISSSNPSLRMCQLGGPSSWGWIWLPPGLPVLSSIISSQHAWYLRVETWYLRVETWFLCLLPRTQVCIHETTWSLLTGY